MKGEKCKSREKSKVQLSVLLCFNASGTENSHWKICKTTLLKNVKNLPCDSESKFKNFVINALMT